MIFKNRRNSKWFVMALIGGSLTIPAVGQSSQGADQGASGRGTMAASGHNASSGSSNLSSKGEERLYKEVRHELVMLPYYGVFDNLAYKVSPDSTVTLFGQVVNPTLKKDAESVVKGIEGVEKVDNQIQVLPPSPFDDQIRRATLRAIYSENSPLFRYGISAVAPIHIIVNGGRVTLEGVVDNETDKNLAEMKAKQVSNVFSVTNNLVVASSKKS